MITLLLLAAATATACQQDTAERCAALESLIQQKQDALEINCSRDSQCFVAELTVGQFMAVRSVPVDPEFAAARDTYERECIDTSTLRRFNVFDARCLPRPDAPDYGHCQMIYQEAVVPPARVQEVLAGYCNCSTHDECNANKPSSSAPLLCAGQCLCDTPCRAGCSRASQCQGWEALGIGTTFDACAETCAVSSNDPRTDSLMRCLAAAPSCTDVSACVASDDNPDDSDASNGD